MYHHAQEFSHSSEPGAVFRKKVEGEFHQPDAALLVLLLVPGVATAGKPDIDPSYADAKLVYMIGPHLITNPNPNLYAQSQELYLLVYPINPTGSTTLGPL